MSSADNIINTQKLRGTASRQSPLEQRLKTVFDKYYVDFAVSYNALHHAFLVALLVFEVLIGVFIIKKVAYTEIDWIAYMQEVSAWQDEGELDYMNIRGDTGPLVYPAGFLYLFAVLRRYCCANDNNCDIEKAQYVFLVFYVITQGVVLLLFQQRVATLRKLVNEQVKSDEQSSTNETIQKNNNRDALVQQIWHWRIAMTCICLSKRLHSIFLLRLFNDGPTMMLLYVAVYLFTKQYWNIGCVVFSLAVSIKMNVLLFAPGLLLLLLQTCPNLLVVIRRLLFCCALPQLVLGFPFLSTFPVSYLRKAFELDRVFFYKWTVNLKFLPEDVFLSKPLSLLLLACHLSCLTVFAWMWMRNAKRSKKIGKRIFWNTELTPHYIVYTMLVSNFVGICFARTLHYQFYSWYFHAIPYILWSGPYPLEVKLITVLLLEYAFLTFPATPLSSGLLQLAHFATLVQIRPPSATEMVQRSDDYSDNEKKYK